jgi:hypothetical protein
MKITISQPASVDDHMWDVAGVQSPASVTVDLDDGTRIDFTAQFQAVLDLNPGGPDYPEQDFTQSVLARSVREPGHFTITMDRVKDVELSHPTPDR